MARVTARGVDRLAPFELVQQLRASTAERLRAPFDDGVDQAAFRAEVVVDRRGVGVGGLGDVAYRHRVDAACREQLLGRRQQSLTRVTTRGAHPALVIRRYSLALFTGSHEMSVTPSVTSSNTARTGRSPRSTSIGPRHEPMSLQSSCSSSLTFTTT